MPSDRARAGLGPVRRRLVAAGITGVVAVTLAVPAAATTALGIPPPPSLPLDTTPGLGDQPHLPARTCTFHPPAPGEMREMFTQWWPAQATAGVSGGDTVDPLHPCRIFQVRDRTEVMRSDDGGRSFSTVLGITPPPGPAGTRAPAVSLAPAAISTSDDAYVVDTTGSYGVMHSGDSGEQWEERSHGLPVAGQVLYTPMAVAFAPSAPLEGYTLLSSATTAVPPLLFRTADGGASWSLVSVPATAMTSIAVDPSDAGHVFVGDRQSAAVWETGDAGGSWSEHPLPSGWNRHPLSLLVTHPAHAPAGQVRLYAETADIGGGIGWARTFDDGNTWLMLPVMEMSGSTAPDAQDLIADPANPDRMVLAARSDDARNGDPLTLYTSDDGFATERMERPLRVSWSSSARPFVDDPSLVRLMADRSGDLFLEVVAQRDASVPQQAPVGDHLYTFRLSALAALAPAPDPPTAVPPPVSGPPSPSVAPTIRQCPLPSPFPPPGPLAPLLGSQQNQHMGGALTYDGRYLDYSEDDATPAVTGLIERVDPVTCEPAPPLRPQLPSDPANPTFIEQLTYDSRYVFAGGDVGAILVLVTWRGASPGVDPFPIYAVDPGSGASEVALLIPSGFNTGGGAGAPVFTYDVGSDDLWTAIGNGVVRLRMPSVHGSVATAVDTCMSTENPFGDYYATLLAVGGGIMFAQMEDDSSVLRGDDRSCTELGGFYHAHFSEPPDEDEQIACDPITFGEHSAYATGGNRPVSALWVRDSVGSLASAYAIPDSYCPFPTTVTLRPSPTAEVGSALTLCAVLASASAGRPPIAGETLTFSIDGRPAGWGRTDSGGRACAATTAPPAAGAHLVRADFQGTHITYMPSFDQGPLGAFALARGARGGTAVPPLVGEAPALPIPQVQPQGQPGVQAQADAQLQVQTGTQSASQSQPMVVMQRQRQRQVATEVLPQRLSSPVYQAVAVVLLLGLGLVARRPAPQPAHVRRRRGGV